MTVLYCTVDLRILDEVGDCREGLLWREPRDACVRAVV